MKSIFLTFSIFFSASLIAGTHHAKISHIDYPQTGEENTLLYLSDSAVVKVSSQKGLMKVVNAKEKGHALEITTDNNNFVTKIREIPERDIKKHAISQFEEYQPTTITLPDEATIIYKKLRRDYTSYSQCYNRAHIWAYESKNKFNLDSMKVFMFYTRKYLREYNFPWWFHVAPFVYQEHGGNKSEVVFDPFFTKAPTEMKAWTELFMKNKVNCPVIHNYSEYEKNQNSEYCYLQKTSMYYNQPLDLENLEKNGIQKTQWFSYEIRRAYRNGFGAWF